MKYVNLSLLMVLIILVSCKTDIAKPESKVSTKDVVSTNLVKEKSQQPDLTKYGMANNAENVLGGLKVGETAPDFSLNDQTGKSVNLYSILNDKEIILTFFRGNWCPYCSKQLGEYSAVLTDLQKAGMDILAITPENQTANLEVTQKLNLKFPILHDADHNVSKAYKGFFHVTDLYAERVEQGLQKSIAKQNGDAEAMLNVPATYVIGKDKKIKYAFYSYDYSQRAQLEEIMEDR